LKILINGMVFQAKILKYTSSQLIIHMRWQGFKSNKYYSYLIEHDILNTIQIKAYREKSQENVKYK